MTLARVVVGKNINNVMAASSLNSILFKGLFLLSLIMIFSGFSYGQVTIKEEPEIQELMNRYIQNNSDTPMVRAWRIQIITTNDRSSMDRALVDFRKLYPNNKYEWSHNPPYYQVRTGAYEKKSDLEAFLLKIKKDFPSAIPVQDDIDKKEIIFE